MGESKKTGGKTYEIVVEGQLDASWGDWFDGLEVKSVPDGAMVICGPVADPAALHRILEKIRDLNCELVSLKILA